ncbi:expressed unknown protein [Seminavis robusta]|uniref:Uncharacterized protein n=1 Tax=Seminavis robusta TaxID=568900 RepID=A0A9N8DGM4_9STRA|nr:expressed unknown protein [Seminavis robusta]|eukprot:Sro58_g033630.1 n/a (866) ;mRNA; r:25336-28018
MSLMRRRRCRVRGSLKAILLHLVLPLVATRGDPLLSSSRRIPCTSPSFHNGAKQSCHHFLVTRGGGDDNDNDETPKKKASANIWSANSLHRMHQDSLSFGLDDINIPKATNTKQQVEKKKADNKRGNKKHQPQESRVKADPNPKLDTQVDRQQPGNNTRPGLFRWLGLAQQGDKPSGDNENADTNNKTGRKQDTVPEEPANKSSTTTPDLAKLWWVNVWAQQLPERTAGATSDSVVLDPGEEAQGKLLKNRNKGTEEESKKEDTKKSKPKRVKDKDQPTTTSKKKAKNEPLMNTTSLGLDATTTVTTVEEEAPPPSYVSTGLWAAVDGLTSLGLSRVHPAFRISRPLRPIRKTMAHITGLHGVLSGKPTGDKLKNVTSTPEDVPLGEEDLAMVRKRLAAIDRARENVERVSKTKGGKRRKGEQPKHDEDMGDVPQMSTLTTGMSIPSNRKSPAELKEEQSRKDRVKEIDKLMSEAQKTLQELACEKDVLQRRPNPLWNYTAENGRKKRENETPTSRRFNFPPQDLVDEYLDFLFSSGRLVKLNHTDLWQSDGQEDDEEDIDDFGMSDDEGSRNRNGGNKGGFWILRQSIGSGSTLGEKIGKAAEEAAYKAIAKAVMEVLSKSISALHGVNIMTHTDIRLFVEATPDLPPVLRQGIIPGGKKNYAREALQGAMRKRNREKRYPAGEAFVQHDAVVETLLSHCQISAPLLTLFPLAWQRAMLSNIILLVTAIVTDFCEGIQLEILGHKLSFSFTPITESDILNHITMSGLDPGRRSWQSQQFERAVEATAKDLSENLKFLDRWHERALGSGVLRSQIATLIARLVLTLVGDILGAAQLDLWAAHAGGPRIVAGLEYRTTPTYMEPQI